MTRLLATAALLVAFGGCSVAGGAQAGYYPKRAGDDDVGAYVSGRLQPMGDRSLVLGFDGAFLGHASDRSPRVEHRSTLFVGYGRLPLRDTSRVQVEAGVTASLGELLVDDRVRDAWAPGAQLALPIRLSPSQPPWSIDRAFDVAWVLDVRTGAAYHVPFSGGFDQGRLELMAGVGLRALISSSLFP